MRTVHVFHPTFSFFFCANIWVLDFCSCTYIVVFFSVCVDKNWRKHNNNKHSTPMAAAVAGNKATKEVNRTVVLIHGVRSALANNPVTPWVVLVPAVTGCRCLKEPSKATHRGTRVEQAVLPVPAIPISPSLFFFCRAYWS